MSVHGFTSFSFAYLPKARVLARTWKKHHPDWPIWAVITDVEPDGFEFDLESEDFDHVIWAHDLFADVGERWFFCHDVVEACTAVKGRALKHILGQEDCEKLFYLDPDIAIFSSLAPLADLLDGASIILTPHQVDPDTEPAAIRDNEIASLHYGTFNLGFLGVRYDPTTAAFADWWENRLQDWCHDRLDIGVFVDQKWCNLIPAFFDNVKIIRDPGYNVASWNLSQRLIKIGSDGRITVNGSLLRFYHFTKLGPIGDTMTQRYAGDNIAVYEIWAWYRHMVARNQEDRIPDGYWYYGRFDDCTEISKDMRELYRSRPDLDAFPKPRRTGDGSFLQWLRVNSELG